MGAHAQLKLMHEATHLLPSGLEERMGHPSSYLWLDLLRHNLCQLGRKVVEVFVQRPFPRELLNQYYSN